MSYAVDTFQNAPPDRRWTGVVTKHPDEGGPGTEVHRRIGYPSEAAAAEGCDAAIAKHAGWPKDQRSATCTPTHAPRQSPELGLLTPKRWRSCTAPQP